MSLPPATTVALVLLAFPALPAGIGGAADVREGGTRVFVTPEAADDERTGLVCRMVNDGRAGRRVRVEALDGQGRSVADTGTFTLETGARYLSGFGSRARRCRFRIAGDLRGMRADGLLLAPGRAVRSLAPVPSPGS